jgi:hypothetical protein
MDWRRVKRGWDDDGGGWKTLAMLITIMAIYAWLSWLSL